jgi:hypothetical protein
MTHTDDDILGLSPLTPNSGFGFDPSQLFNDETTKSTEDISSINQDTFRKRLIIEAISKNACGAMHSLLGIDQTICSTFQEMAGYSMKTNEECKGTSYEAYCTSFNDRLIKIAARHFLGILEVGAVSIAKEVMRQPKPADHSFLKRLLG